MDIKSRLQKLNIELPEVIKPIANYLPYVISEKFILVSGQLPFKKESICYQGKIGVTLTLEEGKKAAKLCAINLLAQVQAACKGNLELIKACLSLRGYINCQEDFTHHPQVLNGASDFMVSVLGDKGRHSRAAVGVNSLPLGACIEIEGIFEIM